MTQVLESCHKHLWFEIESDAKGIPIRYKCVRCLMEYILPSRDKQAREYLRLKYNKQQ